MTPVDHLLDSCFLLGSMGAPQGQQQQSSPPLSSSAPQSARQRLAKLTASLIGVASAECMDGGSESGKSYSCTDKILYLPCWF